MGRTATEAVPSERPDALDALDDVLEALPQIDGFEPWRQVGPREHTDSFRTHATAYVEITAPGHESAVEHLIALPTNPTPCSTTAPPRTARTTAAVDQQNGVL
ncbi:hypothetical protein GS891_11455 [Rhodococcus hoagii]|nr:hypothetical protein [Prescottella equi]